MHQDIVEAVAILQSELRDSFAIKLVTEQANTYL